MNKVMRLALLISYDGTNFLGWNDVRDTALRPALATVLGLASDAPLPRVEAASRTDAGVHAAGQVCSFALDDDMERRQLDCGQMAYSLNQLLPGEVAIRSLRRVDDTFDVRANMGKIYEYRFSTRPGCRDPLSRLYEWHAPPRRGQADWDASAAIRTASAMRGRHSFAAFGNRPRGRERNLSVDPMCELHELKLAAVGEAPGTWSLTVRGNRFLYKMVRNLAGTLVRVGHGELACDDVLEALACGAFQGRGTSLPLTAPAHGLVLRQVEFVTDPFGDDAVATIEDGQ